MESIPSNNYLSFNYPKISFNTQNPKKSNLTNIKKIITNPLINRINLNSHFIFDQFDYIKYFKSLKNKNLIKLSDIEITFLKSVTKDILQKINSYNNNNNIFYINENIYNNLINYNNIYVEPDERALFFKKVILENKNRANLSCRKLANLYFLTTGNKIGKSTVNNILRKQLDFHFLKTSPKSNFLKKESGILSCLCFLKAFVRCIKLGYQPIFIDESKIELINNHFKCWRMKLETIYFGDSSKIKNNLILAVGIDNIFEYKITTENTNSEIFLEFLKSVNDKIKKKVNTKYILIMDNFVCHKNPLVIDFLVESKLNVIFNAPYCSSFNTVELCFRAIKKKTYSNLYNSIDDINNEIKNYLNSKEIGKTLLSNYNETLNEYIRYSEQKKVLNLNNFDITD